MKSVNVDDVLKILHKYGKYIFVTDEKRYSSMVDEIANLKALEQEPCEDAVSRQAVLDLIRDENSALKDIFITHCAGEELSKQINKLQSVQPKAKTGRWIEKDTDTFYDVMLYKCDKCGDISMENGNYCSNCGARMVEPQESEDKK